MAKTRAELEAGFASVDRTIAMLVEDLWNAFAGETETLIEDATEPDVDWLHAELDKILDRNGLKIPEDELPPDG